MKYRAENNGYEEWCVYVQSVGSCFRKELFKFIDCVHKVTRGIYSLNEIKWPVSLDVMIPFLANFSSDVK